MSIKKRSYKQTHRSDCRSIAAGNPLRTTLFCPVCRATVKTRVTSARPGYKLTRVVWLSFPEFSSMEVGAGASKSSTSAMASFSSEEMVVQKEMRSQGLGIGRSNRGQWFGQAQQLWLAARDRMTSYDWSLRAFDVTGFRRPSSTLGRLCLRRPCCRPCSQLETQGIIREDMSTYYAFNVGVILWMDYSYLPSNSSRQCDGVGTEYV